VLLPLPLTIGALVAFLLVGQDRAGGQDLRFQRPAQAGQDPFTKPADVPGRLAVDLEKGRFGGSASKLVCDRERLIRLLRERPAAMREWARIRGIPADADAVARYVRRLRPATVIRDERATSYRFSAGRAVGFDAVLQAGTAVLVSRSGAVVVRCRCGNPLSQPTFHPTPKCVGCPRGYQPPPRCVPAGACYRLYPEPPTASAPASGTRTGRRQ
jgi:hypothetical protein